MVSPLSSIHSGRLPFAVCKAGTALSGALNRKLENKIIGTIKQWNSTKFINYLLFLFAVLKGKKLSLPMPV